MSDQGLGEASGQEARPQPGTGEAHTPGPWEVFAGGDWITADWPGIQGHNGQSVVVWGDGDEDAGVHGDTRDEALANARLIASAPDMLAALKAVTQSTEWSCMERDTQDAVFAAIAKATSPSASIGGE